MEAHPHLPLYLTGNAKGIVNLWSQEQFDDHSLDQWFTVQDVKNANPKKTTVKKLAFSSFGENFSALSLDGSFNMFRFDLLESSKTNPLFAIPRAKEQKFFDFGYMNDESLVAFCSVKPKRLWLFDTLVGPGSAVLSEQGYGGNLLLCNQPNKMLLTFNDKAGLVNVFDLRKGKTMVTHSLGSDEITAVCFNRSQTSLIVGFKGKILKVTNYGADGTVKVFSTASVVYGNPVLVDQVTAFQPQQGNKKVGVSYVKVHPQSGALFVSSTHGHVKLLRINV